MCPISSSVYCYGGLHFGSTYELTNLLLLLMLWNLENFSPVFQGNLLRVFCGNFRLVSSHTILMTFALHETIDVTRIETLEDASFNFCLSRP